MDKLANATTAVVTDQSKLKIKNLSSAALAEIRQQQFAKPAKRLSWYDAALIP